MRAIWFILKLPLKILMAPVILSLTLLDVYKRQIWSYQ